MCMYIYKCVEKPGYFEVPFWAHFFVRSVYVSCVSGQDIHMNRMEMLSRNKNCKQQYIPETGKHKYPVDHVIT